MKYLIVGAGLFGSVFAREKAEQGHQCLVIEKRNHVGGNCHTAEIEGIMVHQYGPHLFHTNNKHVWDYVNRFAEFNTYRHRVKARYLDNIYSMPINLMTFYQLWGCTTPLEARLELGKKKVFIENPQNLEEWALSQVGEEIYYKLIHGYTKKQWMRDPKELPASIIKRLPIRLTWNDEYYPDHMYQGVPVKGFTHMVENILDHPKIKLRLNSDFFDGSVKNLKEYTIVYSGSIDRLFDYEYGELEYRTLGFLTQVFNGDFQGCGQINYTHESIPYTRIIEHKHFDNKELPKTVVTYEYPEKWHSGAPQYLPINDEKNNALYQKYKQKLMDYPNLIVGGRLGSYRYLDMHMVISSALKKAKN